MSDDLDPDSVLAGRRIKQLRTERNWSRMDLAKATGYDPKSAKGGLSDTRLANYERGFRQIGIAEAKVLGAALSVSPSYLMGFTNLRESLTLQERELVRDFRALPENDRETFFREIKVRSLPYRSPVSNERLGKAWAAPSDPAPAPKKQAARARK